MKSLIILLTLLNLFNYVERFFLSASLSQIQKDLGLNDFQSGLLFTAFVVPYVVSSVAIAFYADKGYRGILLRVCSLVWSGAALLGAGARNFIQLFLTRSLLGVGEAAFASIAPGVIHYSVPPEKRSRMMAYFSMGLPLGMAIGFVGGGMLAENYGWRMGYFLLALPAFLISLLFFFKKDFHVGKTNDSFNIKSETLTLLKNRDYLLGVLGYSAYIFVVGGVTHFMPKYIEQTYLVSISKANMVFGGAAIGFGLLGTLFGGWLSDFIEKRSGKGAIKTCALSMIFAFVPFLLTLNSSTLTEFTIYICFAQFFLFMPTSPINVAVLDATDEVQSGFAMALLILISHLLGDAISAPAIGLISDLTNNLQYGLFFTAPFILLGAGLWVLPIRRS